MSAIDDAELKIKHWWKSFTIWLGAFIVGLSQIPPEMIAMIHPNAREWAYSVVGVALIYTRLFGTRQAVTYTAAQKPVIDDK
jgi:hypothetical protein